MPVRVVLGNVAAKEMLVRHRDLERLSDKQIRKMAEDDPQTAVLVAPDINNPDHRAYNPADELFGVEAEPALLRARLAATLDERPLDGDRETHVLFQPNPETGRVELDQVIGELKSLWPFHSNAPAAWVESDDPVVAAAIAQYFDCPTSRPAGWGEPNRPPTKKKKSGRGGVAGTMLGLMFFFLLSRLWLRTNTGLDFQAKALGGDAFVGETGTATGVAATTLTKTAAGWTVDAWRGHVVFMGACYAVIVSNSATVLTLDKWYAPGDPGGTAAATPAAGVYVIGAGQAPNWWVAFSTSATAENATDTGLAGGELNNGGGGLNRAVNTWAHTTGAATYTLTKTYTMNGSDGASLTLQKAATFNTSRDVTGQHMMFERAIPSPPTLVPADQITPTWTVTM